MPYIEEDKREKLNEKIDDLSRVIVEQSKNDTDFAGLLNYSITRVIMQIIKLKFKHVRYWNSCLIRGVLGDVKDEFYRRVVSQYEDKKIIENGDVPEYREEINCHKT